MTATVFHTHRRCKIVVTERPNFWDADIHYGYTAGLYAYVYSAKAGNRTLEDFLSECRQVINEGIDSEFIFKGRRHD